MPFNGSGTFNRLYSWVVDAANNVNISSSRMDAEINGMAAALTNCITRDGQSPPSANLPMGGLKITNLGGATTGTDALNRDTADSRYLLTSITTLSLSGAFSAANGAFSGTLGVTGLTTLSGGVNVTGSVNATSGNIALLSNGTSFLWTDANGGHPAFGCDGSNNLTLNGTDASGLARTIFSVGMHSGSSTFNFSVTVTAPTPSGGDNSTKVATTAFVAAAISAAAGAPLNSPAFTGTPTAPTAAAGTATTQLATTAFADVLRDVPSNAKAANYPLALTDRGQGVDFNGTSLTCTIPANASVAFPVGTVIVITNLNSTSLSIAITSDTLTMSGTTTTGTRTLGQNGEARIRKVGATSWLIAGTALS